jgi:tRNA A37 threonylcarbamoyladenosine dehydratase
MALKNVKQFQIQLMLIGLNSLGIDEVNNMIELSRDELGRYQVKRIKDKIKQIKKTKELTEVNPLISELDSKVKNANPYYR